MRVIITKNLQESLFTRSIAQGAIERSVGVTHGRAREKPFRFVQNLTDWNSSMGNADFPAECPFFCFQRGS